MALAYKIDKERRLVITTTEGVVSKEDVLLHQEQLGADPAFDSNFAHLVDLRQMRGAEQATSSGMREIAEKTVFSLTSRRGFVVDSDLAYGLIRMLEALREFKGEQQLRVFKSMDEALDWIAGKGECI